MSETSVATAWSADGADAAAAGHPDAADLTEAAEYAAGYAAGLGDADTELDGFSAGELVSTVRETFAAVEPAGPAAASWFFEHFFAANPRYRKYFTGEQAAQDRRLYLAVRRIVQDLDRPGEYLPYLRRLALRQRKFGLRAAHYEAFGVSLLATLEHFCGKQWDDRAAAAWQAGYGLAAAVMLGAAADADAAAPAFWEAEVVGHELIAPDVARLTLRPLQDPERPGPYAYRAGQYAALETPSLVWAWRDYSFASAPRADGPGEVEFHVQAGRPGGVGEVLVRATEAGQRLRLAAAEGELAFPSAERARRLLAVGHGTGAAPIRALIEEAIAAGDRRPATVLLVSDEGPHYLAGAFAELAQQHPALTVETAGADSAEAVMALAADQYARGGGWGAVLVGPGALVEQWRLILVEAGVDPADVATDLFD